jgi:proteasome accessory factor B
VRAILDALVSEERLAFHYEGGRGQARSRAMTVDPYTLLVYKKGLYLVAFSHGHGDIRTFALDSMSEVLWHRGHRFTYPSDYDPAQVADGAFGLFRGGLTTVRLFFSERVARFVARRRWHPSQKVSRVAGGVEVVMTVAGTTELKSWVLGFGAEAEVREPEALRREIADELTRAVGRYPG